MARLAVAYAIALQSLLAAWSGVASAHGIERDAALTLCRTFAADDAQPSNAPAATHCVAMCLSGGCGFSYPPAPASIATEYTPKQIAVLRADDRQPIRSIAQLATLSARGPPTIV